MLVLTRKPGQSVYIGEDVKVTLMEIKGNQVRVGIDAPASVRIYREEIYFQILEENKSAAAHSAQTRADLEDVAQAWKTEKPRAISNFEVTRRKKAKSQDES